MAIICTMDVSSLYTNIPHQEGVSSAISAIQHSNVTIRFLMHTILERNCFKFNGRNYLQITGPAMAPGYANLFMSDLETKLFQSSPNKPYLYHIMFAPLGQAGRYRVFLVGKLDNTTNRQTLLGGIASSSSSSSVTIAVTTNQRFSLLDQFDIALVLAVR